MLDLLVASTRSEEECRNVVAECLGRMALLHPQEVLSRLQQGLSSDSEQTRGVVVGAIKYMVVDKPHPVDDLLKVGERLLLWLYVCCQVECCLLRHSQPSSFLLRPAALQRSSSSHYLSRQM